MSNFFNRASRTAIYIFMIITPGRPAGCVLAAPNGCAEPRALPRRFLACFFLFDSFFPDDEISRPNYCTSLHPCLFCFNNDIATASRTVSAQYTPCRTEPQSTEYSLFLKFLTLDSVFSNEKLPNVLRAWSVRYSRIWSRKCRKSLKQNGHFRFQFSIVVLEFGLKIYEVCIYVLKLFRSCPHETLLKNAKIMSDNTHHDN